MMASRDQATIWHPFTQHQTSGPLLPMVRGAGAYLIDEQHNRYLDLISSWWVNLHGHSHPEIANAIYQQAMTLEHVIFAGFTHEPAIAVAETLLTLLPSGFAKIFYSDNGSTAVEIALKMAYQYWYNHGKPQRQRFIAFERGYHGDTIGAMSVGKQSGFFSPFDDLLFSVEVFPYPATWLGDASVEQKEQHVLDQLTIYLEQHGAKTAALIIEPLVQGAGGMQMCRPTFLQRVERLVQSYDVWIIYDEVMTGMGRTGDYFACVKAQTNPDIICFAKGLTGGFLPLAVTACHERIYQAFLGDHFSKALAHGHSYTANPLGCSAALASLQLLQQKATWQQIANIEAAHQHALPMVLSTGSIEKARYCGTIAAFDLKSASGYDSQASRQLQARLLEQGLLVRPLGNVIYFLPPYCVTAAELHHAYDIVVREIQGVYA